MTKYPRVNEGIKGWILGLMESKVSLVEIWCRLEDGRLAYPFHGRGGCRKTKNGRDEIVSETDFRLQNGWIVTVDESGGEKRRSVGEPRPGEWWQRGYCERHEPHHPWSGEWREDLVKFDWSESLRCGCLVPMFAPGAMDGPAGVQG